MTAISRRSGEIRFLTWNIQKGGGGRLPDIMSELHRFDADFVALTEVTRSNLDDLRWSLDYQGFRHIETTCTGSSSKNSVLVASKLPFNPTSEQIPADPERWLAVEIPSLALNVLSVHIPASTDKDGKGRKGMLWDEVIRYAQRHRDQRVVLLGDFNTGLQEDAEGTPFAFSDRIRILRLEKYVDAWRSLNPKRKEYTWYSTPPKGVSPKGFRLDHIYASRAISDEIRHAGHDHTGRLAKLSDHSIVWADIALGD